MNWLSSTMEMPQWGMMLMYLFMYVVTLAFIYVLLKWRDAIRLK